MILFGLKENIYIICISGFIFFSMLPFANNCLDYLVRTNIADELQGRVWGLIGFLSQVGYAAAYIISGILADKIAVWQNMRIGRAAAWVIILSGILLVVTAIVPLKIKSINELEEKVS